MERRAHGPRALDHSMQRSTVGNCGPNDFNLCQLAFGRVSMCGQAPKSRPDVLCDVAGQVHIGGIE